MWINLPASHLKDEKIRMEPVVVLKKLDSPKFWKKKLIIRLNRQDNEKIDSLNDLKNEDTVLFDPPLPVPTYNFEKVDSIQNVTEWINAEEKDNDQNKVNDKEKENDQSLAVRKSSRKIQKKIQSDFISMKKISKISKVLKRKKGNFKIKDVLPSPCQFEWCGMDCDDVSEERRFQLNRFFWSLNTDNQRKLFLREVVKLKKLKNEDNLICHYYINIKGVNKRVCLEFLLKTLNIKESVIINFVKNSVKNVRKENLFNVLEENCVE